jgi:hypothetical protein
MSTMRPKREKQSSSSLDERFLGPSETKMPASAGGRGEGSAGECAAAGGVRGDRERGRGRPAAVAAVEETKSDVDV